MADDEDIRALALTEYALGTADAETVARVERALEADPTLGREVEEVRRQVDLIAQAAPPLEVEADLLLEGVEPSELGEDLMARLMAIPGEGAAAREEAPSLWQRLVDLWRRAFHTPWLVPALAVAAALVFIVPRIVPEAPQVILKGIGLWDSPVDPKLAIPPGHLMRIELVGVTEGGDQRLLRPTRIPGGSAVQLRRDKAGKPRWVGPDARGDEVTVPLVAMRLLIEDPPEALRDGEAAATLIALKEAGAQILVTRPAGRWLGDPVGEVARLLDFDIPLDSASGLQRLFLVLGPQTQETVAGCLDELRRGIPLTQAYPLVGAPCVEVTDSWQASLMLNVVEVE